MHVNSILNLEESNLAISSHWVISRWTSLTTVVTLVQSKPHLVSRGSSYFHSTSVLTQISSSWPSIGKIWNQRLLVECAKTSCRRLKRFVVSWPRRCIPTDCTPSTLWQFLSPNAHSGIFGLPLNDRCIVTMVGTTFCCHSCWYHPCDKGSSGDDARPGMISCCRENWKYQSIKDYVNLHAKAFRTIWVPWFSLTNGMHMIQADPVTIKKHHLKFPISFPPFLNHEFCIIMYGLQNVVSWKAVTRHVEVAFQKVDGI